MDDQTTDKRETAAAFGATAEAYLDSEMHSSGDDLAQLAAWATGSTRALDVATAAGHIAKALANAGVEAVVAADVAPEMVTTAVENVPNAAGVVADAERLPFETGSFDAVACRIAAHHFPDPEAFVAEVARVLEPGGTLLFEDNVAPEEERLDRFLNRVEKLRDPTHGRSHTVEQWRTWLSDAGLQVEEWFVISKRLDYDWWVNVHDPTPERRAELDALFADPPAGARDRFEIVADDGGVASFANLKLLLCATR